MIYWFLENREVPFPIPLGVTNERTKRLRDKLEDGTARLLCLEDEKEKEEQQKHC
jgi:hypothetical protein